MDTHILRSTGWFVSDEYGSEVAKMNVTESHTIRLALQSPMLSPLT